MHDYMQFGFRFVLYVPFFFSRRLHAIARFLLCMSELFGLASREWYGEENFDSSNIREIVWNSTIGNQFQSSKKVSNRMHIGSVFRLFRMYHFSFPVVLQQLVFWLNVNLLRTKFETIPEIVSKTIQIDFAVRFTFKKETTFWLNLNVQSSNLVSRESYGE